MMPAQHPCPTCGLTGGFHDNPELGHDPTPEHRAEWEASPHKQARDRIPAHLTRPSHNRERRDRKGCDGR